MTELLEWLEGSGLGSIARESLYGFQALVAIHILGLIFSVGILLWVDLRMLGVCLSEQSIAGIYRSLSRFFVVGFSVMFLSGAALFAGFATSAYENTYFRIKILLIVLAGLNAIYFHVLLKKSRTAEPESGRFIRLAGLTSLALWTSVVLCGRLISYSLF